MKKKLFLENCLNKILLSVSFFKKFIYFSTKYSYHIRLWTSSIVRKKTVKKSQEPANSEILLNQNLQAIFFYSSKKTDK